MHLCGIYYTKGTSTFLIDAVNSHLEIDKMLIKKDSTTFLKLKVMACFPEILSSNVRITEGGKYLYLSYD